MNGQILKSPRFVDILVVKTHPDGPTAPCEGKLEVERARFRELRMSCWLLSSWNYEGRETCSTHVMSFGGYGGSRRKQAIELVH